MVMETSFSTFQDLELSWREAVAFVPALLLQASNEPPILFLPVRPRWIEMFSWEEVSTFIE
jgi:hypothetical protein